MTTKPNRLLHDRLHPAKRGVSVTAGVRAFGMQIQPLTRSAGSFSTLVLFTLRRQPTLTHKEARRGLSGRRAASEEPLELYL